ncbi:MAG: hypothetical protein K5868_06445 [Lachnospiraceae bacterium]|nr:hypothetical protein [Lachnospiraceae bacterium]
MKDDMKDSISDKLSYWKEKLTSDVVDVTSEDMMKTLGINIVFFQIAIGIWYFVTEARYDDVLNRILFALSCGFIGVVLYVFVAIAEIIICAVINKRSLTLSVILIGIIGSILAFIFY